MCDNNAFLRLLAAAQSGNQSQTPAPQKNGQNGKMAADMLIWQQMMAAQAAQAAQLMAYQQMQQQQQGLGEIFRQLNEMSHKNGKKEEPKPTVVAQPIGAGATATIKEGAELKLDIGEIPKPIKSNNAQPNTALGEAMWRILAAQMLQQQNALATKNGTKRHDLTNGVLDLSHKKEPSTSGEETRNSSTPHEAAEHGKKRAPPTETAARLPIQLGWRRQTCIRAITASGVRGDVVYYAPCGKKLSSYAEVIRYLMKNPCPAITRDNFSFSSKLIIGEFIFPREMEDGEKVISKLTEEEILEQINHLASQKPISKATEKKHKEALPRCITPEELSELYDSSDNPKTHENEEDKKWTREPIDDLLLTEIRPLPDLNRIPNMGISGEGFADALMVFEFCQNFADVLSIKKETLPSLEELVAGLEGDLKHVEKVLELTKTLFSLVLEYPGLPNGKKGHTALGQSLADIGMRRENYSELMRQFLFSRCEQGKTLSKLLESQSFEVLLGEKKAKILGFFCNELVCCRNIVREIDNNLEEIGKLKGERWLRDGKGRALRAHQKRKMKEESHHEDDQDHENNSDSDNSRPNSPAPHNNKKLTPGLGQVEILTQEEEAMSVEELDQMITHLKMESDGLKEHINGLSSRVRAFPFGWDRYHRQYWQLPHVPTVLVESLESCGDHNPSLNISETCSKDPKSYAAENFMDPDVFTVLEDLVDEVVLSKIAPEKRKRKKCRRIENAAKRGWWMIQSREQLEQVRGSLHGRGIRERCLHRLLCKSWFLKDVRCQSMELLPIEQEISPSTVISYNLAAIRDAISALEHRISAAALATEGWTPSPLTSPAEEPSNWNYSSHFSCQNDALESLKNRLLSLGEVVQKKYLRANFFAGSVPSIAQVLGASDQKMEVEEENEEEEKEKEKEVDEDKTELIDKWREYIQQSKTTSQLMLAVQCLESSIAWERSLTAAYCQICQSPSRPTELLICDGCQMGYHSNCFKPVFELGPEATWFCPRCREAGGKPICVLCQKEGTPIFPCKKCYNFLHLECSGQHSPDSHSEYLCPTCEPKPFERRVILRGESEDRNEADDSVVEETRRGVKRKNEPLAPVVFPSQMNMDLCRTMLDELEQQPSVGPFMEPVDLELVPGYKEIIANPIDISTIRNKVDSECYDTPEDFASDLELMFNNCRTFNEDDSPVGIAGETLRKFFIKRWRQVKYNYSKRLRRIRHI